MDQENKDFLAGLAILIAIIVFIVAIFPGLGVFGFYKLAPNYAAVEVSCITGSVSETIIHVENGGVANIHHRWIWITRLEKLNTKIHIVEMNSFGEQREGSRDLFHADGIDYEQYPNHITVGYKLKPENLKSYYIEIVESKSYADKRSVLEKAIKGEVFDLLTKENLNEETLENALSESLGGDFAEITSVAYTQKITE